MLKNLFTHLLCIVFFYTTAFPVPASAAVSADGLSEQQIRSQYPDARIVHIEPEGYPQLAERLRSQGYVAATQQYMDAEQDSPAVVDHTTAKQDCDSRRRSDTGPTEDDDTIRVIFDATEDILRSGDSGSKSENAAIVFVIIVDGIGNFDSGPTPQDCADKKDGR